jgi:hypothetical protein
MKSFQPAVGDFFRPHISWQASLQGSSKQKQDYLALLGDPLRSHLKMQNQHRPWHCWFIFLKPLQNPVFDGFSKNKPRFIERGFAL